MLLSCLEDSSSAQQITRSFYRQSVINSQVNNIFWMLNEPCLCGSGIWEPPLRLVYPNNNIPGQLSNVLQDTWTSRNLKFSEDYEQQYSVYLQAKRNPDLHFSGLHDKSSSLLKSDCCTLFAQVSAMFIVVAEQIAQWFVGPLWLYCRGCQTLTFFPADTSLSSQRREKQQITVAPRSLRLK